ncbi:MAG: hypothetical protein BWZ10_01650 [candidate division BRC1 bacterium ADurb.BinA364]|nr:MAG: hypothetical protein BWZ10_01650 [candidate division BRC1 bacterium ADurb.BinA364]
MRAAETRNHPLGDADDPAPPVRESEGVGRMRRNDHQLRAQPPGRDAQLLQQRDRTLMIMVLRIRLVRRQAFQNGVHSMRPRIPDLAGQQDERQQSGQAGRSRNPVRIARRDKRHDDQAGNPDRHKIHREHNRGGHLNPARFGALNREKVRLHRGSRLSVSSKTPEYFTPRESQPAPGGERQAGEILETRPPRLLTHAARPRTPERARFAG